MLLNLDIMITYLPLILAATVLVFFLKTFVNVFTTFLIGFPLHTMILVGFSLAQIGEFSLITAKVGFESGIFTETIYQEFLAVTVLSMVLTPFLRILGITLPLPARSFLGSFPRY
jgi:monovalent cation:H+ antiporter-2, CPA2 family